jgi:two-component sensor histidine kinase
MDSNPLIKKILYSTWVLAIVPAVLVISLLPHLSSKYLLDIEKPYMSGTTVIFTDLNADGVSERVASGQSGTYYYVSFRTFNNQFYDQWNLHDSLSPDISEIFTGDYDHDKYNEVYIFSHSGDSLFINVNEPLQNGGIKIDHQFITRIGYRKGHIAANLKYVGFYDVDGDGNDEFYFTVSSYYTLGTRNIFYFDLARRKCYTRQAMGSVFISPFIRDIDGDSIPEISGDLSASGNYPKSFPYSDSSSWLMVLTPKLLFKFQPVEFEGFANGLTVTPFASTEFKGLVAAFSANGANTPEKSSLIMYNGSGHEICRRLQSDFKKEGAVGFVVLKSAQSDRIFVAGDRLYELDSQLKIRHSVRYPYKSFPLIKTDDLIGNGAREIILIFKDEQRLVVYDHSLHEIADEPFDTYQIQWRSMPCISPLHIYYLYVTSGDHSYLLRLRKNKYYFLTLPAYPAIYFAFFFFIMLIKSIGTAQQKSRQDLNTRLLNLQLLGIKAQLDPHFTFNTLNSIASLIYLEDRQTAYDYMRKFTELVRSMLNDAEKIYRNLGDEIEFVTTYLELEKLRFGEKFDYRVVIADGVDLKVQVPKLVLQTFAENAVKHGIMPVDKGALITISISSEKDLLRLVIEDNGIGREASKGRSKSTGRGIKMTSEFYDILNQINKKSIRLTITDLHNHSGKPAGTRVVILVPVDDYSVGIQS